MTQGTSKEFYDTRDRLGRLLAEVEDPEIPNLSIVDLGMVIDIRETEGRWAIDLAPTYSGCPAIDVIPVLVRSRLVDAGLEEVQVGMALSPPWSTEWISEEGHRKLEACGIASPAGRFHDTDEGRPRRCPHCGSELTTLVSRHGSTPCKASYKCSDCLEPFEYFKCY